MATDNFWGKFRRWRRHRPFWGGLFLILSAIELFLSANMSLGALEIHIGPQGFLSYVLPAILVLCGLLCWFTPQQRLFYGIIALLAALYSFIGLNLGGFVIGMLLGILGGALIIAWGPPRSRPGTPLDGPPTDEPTDHDEDEPIDVGDDIFNSGDDHGRDVEETQQIEIAGHDDRPHEQQPQQVRPAGFVIPRQRDRRSPLQRLGRNRNAITLAAVPLAVTASILVVGSTLPASAEECPKGMPSRSTAASSEAVSPKAAAAAKKKIKPATSPASRSTTKPAAKPASPTAPASTSVSASASASASKKSNPVLDGISNFVDGVSNVLGIGDDESSTPSTSPASSKVTAPATTPATTPAEEPAKTTPPAADPTTAPATTEPAKADPATTEPTPTAGSDDIPCLGARVFGKVASADDIPTVALKPGLMEVGSLTMYDSTYDGVVDMPTAKGSFKALKFSMRKAENKPFKLTIDEPSGGQTVINSKSLTTTGDVKFYTPEFKGKLFGLIPVTFTPDSPPPLTLPVLWFTDVKIQLAYVRCDTLTGDPLKVNG
ncbi:DUF6114 domain-containing protein [Actinoplanes sp. CA-030573]|uniref:DUF6114 domain-containing protein n=1 Tax=Actinoplanes sp. CA-030573 TaxID=3239898 RepID=UPI003D944A78